MENNANIKKLFHSLKNHLNLINNESFINATIYLEKDLTGINKIDQNELLSGLLNNLTTIDSALKEAVKTLEDIKSIILKQPNITAEITPYLLKLFHTLEKLDIDTKDHIQKIQNYKSSYDFEGFIRPILEEMIQTDITIPNVAKDIEKAKEILSELNLYPK